jgi:PKD domain-containing protein
VKLAVVALAFLLFAAPARATLSDAQTIDGPSADVLDIGGAAMAEDGTGGIVYLKREDGHAHVFASRFSLGKWSEPERVDRGQRFDSAWPVIGAANGGRLVVVWAQDYGTGTDRLFSASLDPGAAGFQPPVVIDFNVGEDTATYPSIAMNRGGQALLAYRYLPDVNPDPTLPQGYVNGDVRVQRYNGSVWSAFGQAADRNASAPVRTPDAGNSPKVGIDVTGAGLVAWQEPDDDFVDRIWARRTFATGTFGIPLIVSPQTWQDKPLRASADQFSVHETGFGEAGVVFRQQPGEDSGLTGTRVMLNEIPDQFSDAAGAFLGARIVDGAGDAGPGASTGVASLSVEPRGGFLAGFGIGSSALLVGGDEESVGDQTRIDDGSGSVAPDPVTTLAGDGAYAAAWKTGDGTNGGVWLREARADGVTTTKGVTAVRGGPVGRLLLAGSGLGDGLAAFFQGTRENGQIAAAFVDAPPQAFAVHTPTDFVRSKRFRLSWDPAPNGIGGVTYTAAVDDEQVGEATARLFVDLGPGQLDDGTHQVQIVATDSAGQETESGVGVIRVDRTAPRAKLTARGRRAVAVISDGPRKSGSGVMTRATVVDWGDGRETRGRRRARHVYRHPGRYQVRVRAADRAGNRRTAERRVKATARARR